MDQGMKNRTHNHSCKKTNQKNVILSGIHSIAVRCQIKFTRACQSEHLLSHSVLLNSNSKPKVSIAYTLYIVLMLDKNFGCAHLMAKKLKQDLFIYLPTKTLLFLFVHNTCIYYCPQNPHVPTMCFFFSFNIVLYMFAHSPPPPKKKEKKKKRKKTCLFVWSLLVQFS